VSKIGHTKAILRNRYTPGKRRLKYYVTPPKITYGSQPSDPTSHLERLQLVQLMRLDHPIIRLIPARKVAGRSRIVLEGPEQPVEDRLPEGSAIGIVQCAAVADRDVALPRGHA
jgi:hypothetical protein